MIVPACLDDSVGLFGLCDWQCALARQYDARRCISLEQRFTPDSLWHNTRANRALEPTRPFWPLRRAAQRWTLARQQQRGRCKVHACRNFRGSSGSLSGCSSKPARRTTERISTRTTKTRRQCSRWTRLSAWGGSLPKAQQRLVEAWAEIHRAELQHDWDLLQSGQPPVKIEPLR